MGKVKPPDYKFYNEAEGRYPNIANVMSNKRNKQLGKYVHVVGNNTKHEPENKYVGSG